MSTLFWPIPLIPEEGSEKSLAPAIVQRQNMAIHACALLCGDIVEGE